MKIRFAILIIFALWALFAAYHAISLTRAIVAHSISYECEVTHAPEDCPPVSVR